MKVSYLVEIPHPETHMVNVRMNISDSTSIDTTVFLPVWSPGSYMVRDYSRHLRWIQATNPKGERLDLEQTSKNSWKIKNKKESFEIKYEIYAHELTVRTSHVDSTHAFLQGPSYLMGLKDQEILNPMIEFRFPPLWSKLSTSLISVEGPLNVFKYTAKNYDELIDCPVEIGCHETDGFMVKGIEHHLAFYGEILPHKNDLKADFKKIVEFISNYMEGMPYDRYLFITHFFPRAYGGLEHLNSTALHFDGRKLNHRRDYLGFMALAAHEYFHLWNVKRIRPLELGPFNYQKENYTRLLWLAEGLTSLMDNLFVYQAGLCTIEEYLEFIKSDLEVYYSTPGKKFHSLEDSSYNAWIKLYRPDENSKNSSISYYLKGGLVFLILHLNLVKNNKSIKDFLHALWAHYCKDPGKGIIKEEIYQIIKKLSDTKTVEAFSTMVETTFDIDFETPLKDAGIEMKWNDSATAYLGVEWDFQGPLCFVRTVLLDSPAYQKGLNAGDELISINGMRVFKEDVEKWGMHLVVDQVYQCQISRLGKMTNIDLTFEKAPRTLKELSVTNKELAEKFFKA